MQRHYEIEKTNSAGERVMLRVLREEARFSQVTGPVVLSEKAKAKRAARRRQQKQSRKVNR